MGRIRKSLAHVRKVTRRIKSSSQSREELEQKAKAAAKIASLQTIESASSLLSAFKFADRPHDAYELPESVINVLSTPELLMRIARHADKRTRQSIACVSRFWQDAVAYIDSPVQLMSPGRSSSFSRAVRVQSNEIGDVFVDGRRRLSVQHLDVDCVSSASVTKHKMGEVVSTCRSLSALKLSGKNTIGGGFIQLDFLERLRLEELEVEDMCLCVKALASVCRLYALQRISLSDCTLVGPAEDIAKFFQVLGQLPRLQSATFARVNFEDNADRVVSKAISALAGNPSLHEVVFVPLKSHVATPIDRQSKDGDIILVDNIVTDSVIDMLDCKRFTPKASKLALWYLFNAASDDTIRKLIPRGLWQKVIHLLEDHHSFRDEFQHPAIQCMMRFCCTRERDLTSEDSCDYDPDPDHLRTVKFLLGNVSKCGVLCGQPGAANAYGHFDLSDLSSEYLVEMSSSLPIPDNMDGYVSLLQSKNLFFVLEPEELQGHRTMQQLAQQSLRECLLNSAADSNDAAVGWQRVLMACGFGDHELVHVRQHCETDNDMVALTFRLLMLYEEACAVHHQDRAACIAGVDKKITDQISQRPSRALDLVKELNKIQAEEDEFEGDFASLSPQLAAHIFRTLLFDNVDTFEGALLGRADLVDSAENDSPHWASLLTLMSMTHTGAFLPRVQIALRFYTLCERMLDQEESELAVFLLQKMGLQTVLVNAIVCERKSISVRCLLAGALLALVSAARVKLQGRQQYVIAQLARVQEGGPGLSHYLGQLAGL
eukprot:Colp12_sorted_trinity150504_noHs@12773